METYKFVLMLIFIAAIAGTVFIILIDKSKVKKVTGVLLDDNSIRLGNADYPYRIDSIKSKCKIDLYIRYYGDLKQMIMLMYEPNIGFVLTSEDRDNPKFYLLHEVFIGREGDRFEGYVTDGIFYVTCTVD